MPGIFTIMYSYKIRISFFFKLNKIMMKKKKKLERFVKRDFEENKCLKSTDERHKQNVTND